MKKRKVIQIEVTSPDLENYSQLFALCDDGTMWCTIPDNEPSKWELIPNVPQGED